MKQRLYPHICPSIVLMLFITAATCVAQTLPVTAGLQLWLSADQGVTTNTDGTVSRWADQSGQGNDALQTNPTQAPLLAPNTLNGKPTLSFPGGLKFLDVANSASISLLTENVTILVLVKYDDLSTYRCCVTKTVGNGPAPFDWWNNQSSSAGRTSFWLGNGVAAQNARFESLIPPVVGSYNVMGFSWGNGTMSHYLNDLDAGQFTYTVVPADGGGPLQIGTRADHVTQLKGNLAEVLIYQPMLSSSDVTAVLGYLRTKYALAFNLAPTVAIQNPADGATVPVAGNLPVSVNASDPDGSVAQVNLFNNGLPVASWTKAPYSLALAPLNPGIAKLTAVAIDNLGRSATSAPVSVTVTGSAPATPVNTGLKVWLKADAGITTNPDGTVATWADQSGNANDATQANPAAAPLVTASAINGKPALTFGPTATTANQFLEISDAGTAFTTGDFSTFVIARFTNYATYRVLWSKCTAGMAAPFDWWFQPGTGRAHAYRGNGATFGGPVAAPLGNPAGIFTAVGLTAAGTTISHYAGFSDNGSGTIPNATASLGSPLRIGQRDDGVVQMQGEIAEILIYDRAVSAIERSNVVSYLCSKYGLAQMTIGNQPPVASVTAPANGASFAAGASTPFAVTASDPDGTVASVDLVANGLVVATLTNNPYQVNIQLLTPGTVTLTGIATDNWGSRATSAPVAITVTGSAPTAPPTADLRLWLRADNGVQTNPDGTLTGWTDGSGNNNNALPGTTAPTLVPNALNGKPVVRFDGADNSLQVATAPSIEFTNDITSFAIVRYEDFSTYRALWAKTVGGMPGSVDYYLLPGSGIPRFYRGNGATANAALDSTRPMPAGSYVLVGFDMAGTTANHYYNGLTSGTGQINTTLADGGTPLRIGTRDDGVTKLKGDLAELLIFGRALSATERDQVMTYLAGKYGLSLARMINLPPVVNVVSPQSGATVPAGTVLDLTAQVTDPDSSVTRIDFLANGALFGSVTAEPYSIPLQLVTPGTLTLQVRAVDFWGATGSSTNITVTVTGSGPAAPPSSGLVVWLKSDAGITTNTDGTISAWNDQSGNANHATQADPNFAPVLVTDPKTGKPAAAFAGAMQYLDIISAPTVVLQGNVSSFCTVDNTNLAGTQTIWCQTDLTGRAYPWIYNMAGGTPRLIRGNSDGFDGPVAASPVIAGLPAVIGFTIDGSFTTHYLSGRPNGTGSMGYGALDLGYPLRLGLRGDLTQPFNGNLAELLIYNRALSAAEVDQANNYLAARNGIAIVQFPTQPKLSVSRADASTLQLSWPTAYSGFILEGRADVATGTWTPIATNPPNNQVVIGTTNATRFFRLRGQ